MFEPELEDLSKQDMCSFSTQVQVQVQVSQFHVIPRSDKIGQESYSREEEVEVIEAEGVEI